VGSEPAAVLERVLAVPEETWRLAICRAEVIARLAAMGTVGLDAADAAAAELGVSRRWCICCWAAGGWGKVSCRT
jgi:putative transposase